MRLIALAGFAAMLSAVAQASEVGNPPTASSLRCKTSVIDVTMSDAVTSTNGTAYVNVTDGVVTFKQKKPDCIVVNLTAEGGSSGGGLLVHALLDGVEIFPGETLFAAGGNESHAASWAGNVSAGNHTVLIQIRSAVNGQLVGLNRHTIQVAHK